MRIPLVHSAVVNKDKLLLTFETGEVRYFFIDQFIRHLNATGHQFTPSDLNKIAINEGRIEFHSKPISFTKKNGEVIKGYFDIDPFFAYEESVQTETSVGELFRQYRSDSGLSIAKAASRCHTDKGFISKFENNKLQVEWNTVRKLFYLGFGKRLTVDNLFGFTFSTVNEERSDYQKKIPRLVSSRPTSKSTKKSNQGARSRDTKGKKQS